MATYVDSHIHLSDPAYACELDFIAGQMRSFDIAACSVSVDYDDSVRTLCISQASRGRILPFVGIHPENTDNCCIDGTLHLIRSLAEQNSHRIAGVGEIGLDPTYCSDGIISSVQIHAFERMLEMADDLKKPVSIHSRKSLDRILEIMTSYDATRASLHWFDGGKKQLARALDMGFYISYGPLCVYASDKRRLVELTDYDKLLVETDGPVRFGRCFEGMTAQSCFVASVLYTIAEVRQISFERAAAIVAKNSAAYLGDDRGT